MVSNEQVKSLIEFAYSHDEAPWMRFAFSMLGTKELPGVKFNNSAIVDLWKKAHIELGVSTDEVPWCAAFACACLEQAGVRSPRSGWSLSFAGWQDEAKQPAPFGSVIVFKRPSGGHVGFLAASSPAGHVIIGGNQADQVSVIHASALSSAVLVARRYPRGYPSIPAPVISASVAAASSVSMS